MGIYTSTANHCLTKKNIGYVREVEVLCVCICVSVDCFKMQCLRDASGVTSNMLYSQVFYGYT